MSIKKTAEELRQHKNSLESVVEERTRALQEINQELEAFTFSVSHDLRTPLRHMKGYLELLENEHGQSAFLEKAQKATVEMGTMIDALLNLSQISTQGLRKEKINLSAMLQAAVKNIPAKKIRGQIEIDETPDVFADRDLLQIVLNNLLGNAIKYTGNISNPVIEFGFRQTDQQPGSFFIRDNGCGFKMKYADQVFKVFQRLHSAEEFEGAGVGLSTVMRIIKRHEGKIWVESEVNQGTTFYFQI